MSDFTPPAAPVEPEATHRSGPRLPIDYYTAPASEVRPIFPRWVPLGCGIAATLLIVFVFVIGALIARFGLGSFVSLMFDRMQTEMAPMYAKNVTPAQKQALDRELTQLRTNLDREKVKFVTLEPFMTAMRDAISDQSITPDEVEKLTADARKINAAAAAPPRPHH